MKSRKLKAGARSGWVPFTDPLTLVDSSDRPQTYVRNAQGLHVPLDTMTGLRMREAAARKGKWQNPAEGESETLPLRVYF